MPDGSAPPGSAWVGSVPARSVPARSVPAGSPRGESPPERPSRAAATAAGIAAVLGTGHALVSAYWAAGGTALLDTIGGDLERWARQGRTGLAAAIWAVAALKLVVAWAAPVLAGVGAERLPAWTRGRVPRRLGWVAAATLTLYGGVLTVAGLLVQAGVIEAAADADDTALAWHAYVWDPWFLLWGIAFGLSLRLSRTPGLAAGATARERPGH